MASALARVLKLNAEDQESIAKTTGRIKSVAEFVSDVVDATKDVGFVARLGEIVPWWLKATATSAAEAAPPIRFVATLFAKLGEIRDPDRLAYLAFTTAYQRAVECALRYVGPPKAPSRQSWNPASDVTTPEEGMTFTNYSLSDPLNHAFLREAHELLEEGLTHAGFDEPERRSVHGEVAMRFPGALKALLVHPQTKERFEALADALRLGNTEERVRLAWLDHFEYLRYQFEDKPVFGEEPFTLADVYVDTSCGVVRWGDLHKRLRDGADDRRDDLFDPRMGQNLGVLDAIINLLADPTFRDAIVVQGPAGSGKSALTLRLSVELLRQGLRPIRVRFRDLPLTVNNVMDALPEAVHFWDPEEHIGELPQARADELFLNGTILDDTVDFRGTRICPWILIMDGWDELSVAAERGFAVRVGEILAQIRDQFLRRGNRPLVRVVLTGRPSDAVASSSFLANDTRLLTLRPLDPEALHTLVASLAFRLAEPGTLAGAPARFAPVLDDYARAHRRLQANDGDGLRESAAQVPAMEVLGLPLLAYLAVRLMVRWPVADLRPLVSDSTSLYRQLTDMTCMKGGRWGPDVQEAKLSSTELRELLHETAAAMTVFGRDYIPYDELEARLSSLNEDLVDHVRETTKDHPITSLMISFFFKGGRKELGAEFLHKSFREYLFAEAVVTSLKTFGRRAGTALEVRVPYWKDFEPSDPRFSFSRHLGRLVAPQWLSSEVLRYLHGLVEWELKRSFRLDDEAQVGDPSPALDVSQWEWIRDGLADLWDWWGEGVHLRSQPGFAGKRLKEWRRSFADELVEWARPQEPDRDLIPVSPRTTVVDAHLGDALCRLAVLVHHHLIEGVNSQRQPPAEISGSQRLYQSRAYKGLRFRPTGNNTKYFRAYIDRINAAGWYPDSLFPCGLCLRNVDLQNAWLPLVDLERCDLQSAHLNGANLYGALLEVANLKDAMLEDAILQGANLKDAILEGANLEGAILNGANLKDANLRGAKLKSAFLENANLDGANLDGANLEGANLQGATLKDATLEGAILEIAALEGADLEGASLRGAILYGASLNGANLRGANLDGAILEGTSGAKTL